MPSGTSGSDTPGYGRWAQTPRSEYLNKGSPLTSRSIRSFPYPSFGPSSQSTYSRRRLGTIHKVCLLMLRVVGRLPWRGVCDELGRQASDKPQGRKPRGDQAGRCGRFGLWGFDGGRVAAVRCVVWWMARIWAAAPLAGWICDDFAVALAGLAGRTGGSERL